MKNTKLKKKNRGFAKLAQDDPQRLSEIASRGGKEAHKSGNANKFNSETGRIAGKLGGEARARNLKKKKSKNNS